MKVEGIRITYAWYVPDVWMFPARLEEVLVARVNQQPLSPPSSGQRDDGWRDSFLPLLSSDPDPEIEEEDEAMLTLSEIPAVDIAL